MARTDNGTQTARWAGQRFGANYATPYPGEHVRLFGSILEAAEELKDDLFACTGDSIVLWWIDPSDSAAEAISRTRTDLAEADRVLTLGPRGGIKVERI